MRHKYTIGIAACAAMLALAMPSALARGDPGSGTGGILAAHAAFNVPMSGEAAHNVQEIVIFAPVALPRDGGTLLSPTMNGHSLLLGEEAGIGLKRFARSEGWGGLTLPRLDALARAGPLGEKS